MLYVYVVQSSPLMFHYVIVSRSSVASRTSDVATVRLCGVTAGHKRCSVTSVSSDSMSPLARCDRSSPDFETKKSTTTISDDVVDSVDVEDRLETSAEPTEKSARGNGDSAAVESRTEVASSIEQTTIKDDDDDGCLSISTSVTVVISRRPPTSNSSATSTDQTATADRDIKAALTGNQVVVSATIPTKGASSFPPQQPEVEMVSGCTSGSDATMTVGPTEKEPEDKRLAQDSSNDSTSPHVTTDASRTSGSSRQKRKSLESVIKSLQPTPVVMSRQPEVARSRPEVLVRPMQACAAPSANILPVSTQADLLTGQLEDRIHTPYSQPEVVDLRRPKRPAPTGSHVALGASRRKPKSLSPLQAPPDVVDDPYYNDKRRRFNSGGDAVWPTSARFGGYFPPPAGLCGPAAVAAAAAARYHACLAAARPEMTRLPVYYGSLQQRTEPNGYDAPLELTTKRARDRK